MSNRFKTALLIGLMILLSSVVISCLSPYEKHIARGVEASAKGNYDEAITEFTKVIELYPKDAIGYYWRASAYYDNAQYDLAIKDLTEAIRLGRKSADEDYNLRGLSYYAKGQYDLAILDFSKAIEIDPNPLVYDNRGKAYYGKKDYDLAIKDFTTAISISPRDERLYGDRANTYMAMGQASLAIADLRKVIELSDDPAIIQSAKERLKGLGITE